MEGDDKKRFCGQCQKHVHNLSAMTANEAESLLASSQKLCVRYSYVGDRRPITIDQTHRRRFGFVTAAIAAVASLFGCKPGWCSTDVMGDAAAPVYNELVTDSVGNGAKNLPVTPSGKTPEAKVLMGEMPTITMGFVAPSHVELGKVGPAVPPPTSN